MSGVIFLCKGSVDDPKPSQELDVLKVVNILRINAYLLFKKNWVSGSMLYLIECSQHKGITYAMADWLTFVETQK